MKSIGAYFIFLGSMFVRRESFSSYFKLTINECISIGWNSILIVAITSTFMGAVTTVQTAYNLVSPLIQNYVVAQVTREMVVLELAPTITAIVIAGKVGSSIASGLGTMRITEQIDALEVMGVNASSYLVLPKIIAAMIMYPLLVVIAGFLALYGGYIAGTMTGILTETEYVYGIRIDFNPFTVSFALIKSIVFAFLIASISAFQGFFTTGGALEVGKSSTSAVTKSCIAVLLADYILAELLLN
ncbi:phospholipid/cholesterol/gamma-HCH transport system permease protein [Marivirga sericea]|uniref:Phospholipid/cholesterol/gamma-HCH transport system permease protein n=1 Tax=Marivirga sericea TaxID=1028 RepID=A0A1X7L694_9BACT|nr:ABC transporter permease [Marivirga sericea]SMG49117.1 phospholipid/cholesterol/gamma-HCH transport system permease protein [Marivirga sericea]